MRILKASGLLISLIAVLTPKLTTNVLAGDGADPSWPCVQHKVPEITAAVVWAGPAVNPVDRAWQKDKRLVALVSEHATRRIPLEDAYRQIDAYAAEQVDVGRDVRLSALFVGLLQTINMERNDIIAGIERFSRRQALLAERIKLATRKRTELRKNSAPDAAESEALAQIEKQIVWDSRIFDERNQLLFFVCQSPVILEKRLFALSRRIMSHLE